MNPAVHPDAQSVVDPECRGGRVAFFGGSFDPPHLGHLAIARAARQALRLDRVLFAPVGAQPLKPAGSTAPFPDRLAMTEQAIAGEPGFAISLVDAPSAGGSPNYTLDTLRTLRSGMSAGSCLFFLMGADSFRTLRKWHGAAEIPFVASLIVASRPGQELDDLARFLPEGLKVEACPDSVLKAGGDLPGSTSAHGSIDLRQYLIRNSAGTRSSFYLLPGLDVEISASEIRAQIRSAVQAPAASRLVPAAVAEYIRAHGLYR
jgi:nicotinate-nucleotide adenylyltransferase